MFGAAAAQQQPLNPEDWEDFPAGPESGRRPAARGRIVGNIIEWKGKFGWIMPDAPIAHPEARMKGGKIYLRQEDVLEVISGVGAHVSFYVYADGTGLGAMACVPSDSPAAKKKITKAKATPAAPKPKAKATPGRKRIADTLMHGKVKSWRGGFGFVTPTEPVEHPLFTGSLFLSSSDVTTPDAVDVGKKVSFFLYMDPQGLGAEECTVLDGEDDGSAGATTGSTNGSTVAPSELLDSSGMLKSKPKAAPLASSDGLLISTPKAKSGVMKATPKAAAAAKAMGDTDLAKKMADNPELAKQLSAWLFDAGG